MALILLALGGCASPACRPVVEHVQTPAIEHVVLVPDTRGPDVLISDYAKLQEAERKLVGHTGPEHIHQIIQLNNVARTAMKPIAASDHIATPAEMQSAIVALGSLRAYLAAQKVAP
jgi:hypothetical protein